MSDQEAYYAGAKFKIVNGIIQLNNQPNSQPTKNMTNNTDNEPTEEPTIKVAKPVKSKKQAPIKRQPTEAIDMGTGKVVKLKATPKPKASPKPKKEASATAPQSPATAVEEAEAAPTPAEEQTDATEEQEGDTEEKATTSKGKRDVKAPFNPMDPNWKPTCKFGTAMKRAKKWYSRWKESKDDEKRAKYFRAASGFAQRAIEKASNEAETLEATALSETING